MFKIKLHKLLCTWRVDCAWWENLKRVKGKKVQVTVYHNLRVLREETDCQQLGLLSNETVKQWKDLSTTPNFDKYFQTHYANNKNQWAACYCKEAFVNTTMYVEAFHMVLKYMYVQCVHMYMYM